MEGKVIGIGWYKSGREWELWYEVENMKWKNEEGNDWLEEDLLRKCWILEWWVIFGSCKGYGMIVMVFMFEIEMRREMLGFVILGWFILKMLGEYW